MSFQAICVVCGTEFEARYKRQKYCSKACSAANKNHGTRRYETRTCVKCGNEYITRADGRNKYCGYDCYWSDLGDGVLLVCDYCGKEYHTPASRRLKPKSRHFCSNACKMTWQNLQPENRPHWQGGIKTNDGGYRLVRVNGKYVREHRLVMEKAIGRRLSRSELVHHEDRNKTNNDISNLSLVSASEHTRIHHREMLAGRKKRKKKDGDSEEADG